MCCRQPLTPGPSAAGTFTFNTPGSALNTPLTASPDLFNAAAARGLGKENAAGANAGDQVAAMAASACTLPVAAGGTTHHPIESLNPYRSKWTIRAKVDSKVMKQSFIKGETTSILTVTLTDAAVCPSAQRPTCVRLQKAMLPESSKLCAVIILHIWQVPKISTFIFASCLSRRVMRTGQADRRNILAPYGRAP